MWRNPPARAVRPAAAAPSCERVPAPASATVVATPGERASDFGIILFSAFTAVVAFSAVCVVGCATAGSFNFPVAAASTLAAVLAVMAVHISQQWERVVVQRLGRFSRVAGPGLFLTIPFIEQTPIRVDCRTRYTTFGAEETLTADLVPLDVDAVMLWMVHDAKAACNEVSDFSATVELTAQAALRDAIGRLSAAEVAIRREQLDADIQQILEDEASQWGISILSVKIRNILLPQALQDVMSLEAQAEQRRKARIILMEAEQDISAMAEDVGEAYGGGDAALRLRQMHLMYESVRETGGTVVVPSSFSEGFVEGADAARTLRAASAEK
ncbi:slipin family protein [Adlercreutzia sp. R7]|uniref:Slipin family protein n=1 Tax=Adlercreutzia wanghongyangiae TaxID=3111451 RepID=A0ABU6IK75_9ACTN|nr:slipin family protein [Adlercreutzia sp. R7]